MSDIVPALVTAAVKIHTLRWDMDHAVGKDDEPRNATSLTHGYVEIDGWPMVAAAGAVVRSYGGETTMVTVEFVARSVEYVHHDAESWLELTGADQTSPEDE